MVQGSPDCTDRRDVDRQTSTGGKVAADPQSCLICQIESTVSHRDATSTFTAEQLTCCSIFSPSAFHLSTPVRASSTCCCLSGSKRQHLFRAQQASSGTGRQQQMMLLTKQVEDAER